jgi:SET domain-containing protein
MPSPEQHNDPAPKDGAPVIHQRYAAFKIRIEASPIHRWGVIAGEFIPKGHKVIEYTGERISRAETARRARISTRLNYLFTLDKYWTVDGSVGGSGAEFINHCCEPNCKARITGGHIYYFSKRDIQSGEELTVDYRFDHDVEKVDCCCGAPKCRGTINLIRETKRSKRIAAHQAKRDGRK